MRAAGGRGLFSAAVDLTVFALGRLGFGGLGGFAPVGHRADETVFPEADQILAPGLVQRLNDEPALVRPAPLQQRALHVLFVRRFGDVDGLHRARVNAGVVHARADRAGGGVKILHLLGLAAAAVEILREGHGVRKRAAGVRAHEVRHDVLFLIILVVELAVFVHEALVRADVGLAHIVEHGVDAVLGRDLELAGDVVAHELAEERVVIVAEHVVIADAAAHEHLLHAGDLAQLAQQGEVVRVVGVDVRARRRREA